MISKGLTQFVYIQGLMFCLFNETCSRDCKYFTEEECVTNGCGVFDGKFAYMDRSIMLAMITAYNQHIANVPECKECLFKHNEVTLDDCYYTDFVLKIGNSVWQGKVT